MIRQIKEAIVSELTFIEMPPSDDESPALKISFFSVGPALKKSSSKINAGYKDRFSIDYTFTPAYINCQSSSKLHNGAPVKSKINLLM